MDSDKLVRLVRQTAVQAFRVGFGRTEVSVHQTKALRELFRMGMVSGVLVFKGSQIWAARSIRFQQFGPFFDVFMKRVNGKGRISGSSS